MLCLAKHKETKGREIKEGDKWTGEIGAVGWEAISVCCCVLGQPPHLSFEHHSRLPTVKTRELNSKTIFHTCGRTPERSHLRKRTFPLTHCLRIGTHHDREGMVLGPCHRGWNSLRIDSWSIELIFPWSIELNQKGCWPPMWKAHHSGPTSSS